MPLPSGTIVAERWAHTPRRSPSLSPAARNAHKQKKKKKRKQLFFCLWFMVSASGTLLVDSLNCPSRAKHTPLKKKINTHLFVCVWFPPYVLRVCVFIECLSLLWRKMMRSIILHSLGRHRFLFPWGAPVLCKNIDQEFTVSCKGLYICGGFCHRRHIPTARTCKWAAAAAAWLENSKVASYHFAPWGWG